MTTQDLGELAGLDALDEFDVLRRIEHEIAIDVLRTAARFLTEHREEVVDADRSRLPDASGRCAWVGWGTPRVAEFAPALMAGRLGLSAWSGQRLCADVLDLEFRLPLLWASLGRYEAKAGLARLAARRTGSSRWSRRRWSMPGWRSPPTGAWRGVASWAWSRRP